MYTYITTLPLYTVERHAAISVDWRSKIAIYYRKYEVDLSFFISSLDFSSISYPLIFKSPSCWFFQYNYQKLCNTLCCCDHNLLEISSSEYQAHIIKFSNTHCLYVLPSYQYTQDRQGEIWNALITCLHSFPFPISWHLPFSCIYDTNDNAYTGLSMSKLDVHNQSHMQNYLYALNIKLWELSIVDGCIFLRKLTQATNQASYLSWVHACMLVWDCANLIERPAYKYPFYVNWYNMEVFGLLLTNLKLMMSNRI